MRRVRFIYDWTGMKRFWSVIAAAVMSSITVGAMAVFSSAAPAAVSSAVTRTYASASTSQDLRAGQIIKKYHAAKLSVSTPSTTPVSTYVVRNGDTLSTIAPRLNTSWQLLWWVNRSKVPNPNSLQTGQVLDRPAGVTLTSDISAAAARAAGSITLVSFSSGGPSTPAVSSVGYFSVGTEGGPISTAGMPAFEACVVRAESGGYPHVRNPSSASGLFGIENQFWTGVPSDSWAGITARYPDGAYSASVGVQEEVFADMYAAQGTAPWAPYDGC